MRFLNFVGETLKSVLSACILKLISIKRFSGYGRFVIQNVITDCTIVMAFYCRQQTGCESADCICAAYPKTVMNGKHGKVYYNVHPFFCSLLDPLSHLFSAILAIAPNCFLGVFFLETLEFLR